MLTANYLLTSLVVVLIPGAGVLYTISTALARGRRASFHASVGCTLGIVPHLVATIFGLAAVMHAGAVAFQGLKLAGVAYLFYLAIATWRDRRAFAVQPAQDRDPDDARSIILRGLLVNVLNPKLTIFFLAFLPQFVDPADPSPLRQLLGLSGIFMAMTLAVFIVYGVLAHAFRQAVIESPRVQSWLRRGFASVFAALGAELALADR